MNIIISLRYKARERVFAYMGVTVMHGKMLPAVHNVIHMLVDWTWTDKNWPENSVALVCERTIPTERPPPVGEVSANFCG